MIVKTSKLFVAFVYRHYLVARGVSVSKYNLHSSTVYYCSLQAVKLANVCQFLIELLHEVSSRLLTLKYR